ncbi:MAG TPA: hypothetical protein DEB25_04095, partial [Desulfobulbaceae bacterium]|nr:hypothetical protein [Desulfobulbaceae bacterium]
MQFIIDGPDIPDTLLQAHEEGRVVFFCGAGISYPAKLPGFQDLVDGIYERLSTTRERDGEKSSYKNKQFDTTLHLLERRYPGGRTAVRKVVPEILLPSTYPKGSSDTHATLLQLSRCRKDNSYRLVTTNYDHLFREAVENNNWDIPSYAAPALPVLKKSRWNGIVYLHGLLPDAADENALNNLILTSGDFGLAYLIERWAARFVSELFRNYVVCFVGYTIGDTVVRYMMDALAADQAMGENSIQHYALAPYPPGEDKWEDKGVVPIFYNLPSIEDKEHKSLHKTLQKWAATYRDGTSGKEFIVLQHASNPPTDSAITGQMLWALSDPSGLPAKCFAEVNPAPPLKWLDVFSQPRSGHSNLNHFGVPPHDKPDDNKFCFIRRPGPYRLAQPMSLLLWTNDYTRFDAVMEQIARWLTRHLNDPELLLWITRGESRLHPRWAQLIEEKLGEIANPQMRTLWRLLLAGRVKGMRGSSMYGWKPALAADGSLTTASRLRLRELLAPKVRFEKALNLDIFYQDQQPSNSESSNLRKVLSWEVVLSGDGIHPYFRDHLKDKTRWFATLPHLVDDFQQLLLDALDLLRELGDANEQMDPSFMRLPSISPSTQNMDSRDSLVFFIELLRDAWLEMKKSNPNQARRIAAGWFDRPYPTFKRLALFAAAQDDCIEPRQWIEWLLADEARWLWSWHTRREVCRLFVAQGKKCEGPEAVGKCPEASGKCPETIGERPEADSSSAEQARLEAAILADPPVSIVCGDADLGKVPLDTQQAMVDRAVQLRLSRLRESGLALGAAARERLAALEAKRGRLADDESDEFLMWHSGITSETFGQPSEERRRRANLPPPEREKLLPWLREV